VPPTASPVPPTATLIPPTATATPKPATPTALPSPTLQPDTQPGTTLEVGDEWVQNGVGLRLTRVQLNPQSGWGEQVGLAFEFVNYTNAEIMLSYSSDDFLASSNLGNSLVIKGFYDGSFWCNQNSVVVPAGAKFNIEKSGCPFSPALFWITADLGNTRLTEVKIRATRFSRITDARWRIPINR
jgi:hypothetical protein